jgi:hypothetical protein
VGALGFHVTLDFGNCHVHNKMSLEWSQTQPEVHLVSYTPDSHGLKVVLGQLPSATERHL